jgi:hypothetical protein
VWRPCHRCSGVRSAASNSDTGPTASHANTHTGPANQYPNGYTGPTASHANTPTGPANQYPNGYASAGGIRNCHAPAGAATGEGEY